MKIYYARVPEFSEAEEQQVMQILPGERTERIGRTKLIQKRMQSLSAGLLLEYALREYGLRSCDLTFRKNKDGKPTIAEYPDFYYNLSHSKEYVALVTDCDPVGIDVEGSRFGYQELAKRFFSETEQEALKEHWSDEEFTRIWTRKESYLKASGYGMRMPLDGFSTLGEQVLLNEKMCSDMIEEGVTYYLASIPFGEGYWLSVCRRNKPVECERARLLLQQVDLYEFFKGI